MLASALALEYGCLPWDGMSFGEPAAQIDQPAAFAAERPVRCAHPLEGASAGGALDLHSEPQAQVVSWNGTSSLVCVARSERPFQVRKRTLQR